MGHIEIVGLGAGTFEQLPLGIYKKMTQTEKPVYVRTKEHPVITELQEEDVVFKTFDHIYEENDRFEEVYVQIVAELVQLAKYQSIVYAVPGHPMVAEQTVQLLLEQKEIEVEISGGHSYLDALFTALRIDPIDGFQFVDAIELSRSQLNYRNHLIFTQIYDAFIASNVKLTLLEDLPPDYDVTVVEAAGTPDEVISTMPLEALDRSFKMSNVTALYVPPVPSSLQRHTFTRLRETIAALRSPDGCPWDKKQTHTSLKEYAIEEVYELMEAIDEEDDEGMIEELGDVLLQVMLHSQIGEDEGFFTIDDVIQRLTEKMIHRHPHVFSDVRVDSVADVYKNWDILKKEEKEKTHTSMFDSIPNNLPALFKAYKMQHKAVKIRSNGDDCDIQKMWDAMEDEKGLLRSMKMSPAEIEEGLGHLLFALVRVSRYYNINPELALSRINNQFIEDMSDE